REKKPDGTPLPVEWRITPDGEAERILGAWYGDNVEVEAPWSAILEDLDNRLNYWNGSGLTHEGKRCVANLEFGGLTQYLTQVQGMPKHVEERLTKRQPIFMRGESTNPQIAMSHLQQPMSTGGKKVLDIIARNEVTSLMTLKSYLKI
ncbi:hypothetical protein C8Q75DRAFT_696875, partial [Abortiporus biennis]